MKKEQFFFLLGGFAFGILVGYGLFDALARQPQLADGDHATHEAIAAPSGPRAPSSGPPAGAGGGGAPMVAQINELKRRLQENPQDVEAAATLGSLYYQIGQAAQSVEFYDIAIGISPNDPDLLTDAGMARRQMGDIKVAIDHFRSAHESDPTHWQSLFNMVIVLAFDLGEIDAAEAGMSKLESLDPLPNEVVDLRAALERFKSEQAAAG